MASVKIRGTGCFIKAWEVECVRCDFQGSDSYTYEVWLDWEDAVESAFLHAWEYHWQDVKPETWKRHFERTVGKNPLPLPRVA